MSEIAQKLADVVLGFGLTDKLGALIYPALAVTSIILLILAMHSFKLFKIGFPLLGAAMGYIAGSKAFAGFVADKLPADVAALVDPAIVAGAACALVLLIVFMALRTAAILVLGLGIGYAVIGEFAIDALKNLQFVRDILLNLDAKSAMMLAAILGGVCALITVLIIKKFFNVCYTLITSIGFTVVAFILPAIILTVGMANAIELILMVSYAGMALGFIFFLKQYFRHRYFW